MTRIQRKRMSKEDQYVLLCNQSSWEIAATVRLGDGTRNDEHERIAEIVAQIPV